MNIWRLPEACSFGGVEYRINADFRDVLEIIKCLTDSSRPEYVRWQIAIGLFFEGKIPDEYQLEAIEYLSNFISYGVPDDRRCPKLIDWEQDAQMIIADVSKIAGEDVRAKNFVHWWTFLSYFYGIGEGQLSTIVSIREKKIKGKKLEKWEQEYYRENRKRIDFQVPDTPERAAAKEYFEKWL